MRVFFCIFITMKLFGVTCVYNEEHLVPIVMPYIEKMGYDKFVVWDNGSTDKTVELLSKYPYIEIRSFETENFCVGEKTKRLFDTVMEFRRDTAGKSDDQVWVTIADFDEVYQLNYVNGAENLSSFKDYLFWKGQMGYNVCREHLWNLMDGGKRVEYGYAYYWDKPNIFRIDNIDRTKKFSISNGQHDIHIHYKNADVKIFNETKIISGFHLKYYSKKIFLKRQLLRNKRKNTWNNGSVPFIKYEGDRRKNINAYNEHLKLSIPYDQYFSHKILNGKEEVGEFLI